MSPIPLPCRFTVRRNRNIAALSIACFASFFLPLPAGAQTALTVKKLAGPTAESARPRRLVEASNGILYGTSIGGGVHDAGSVYRLNKDGSGYALLWSFSPGDGGDLTSLIEGSDGILYGTKATRTTAPSTNSGFLFRINKDGAGYTLLRVFSSADGLQPTGIAQGSDGALYGTTYSGGSANAGTVFKINRDGSGFAVLTNFPADRGNPLAGLIQGREGALYGTASRSVFTLNTDGSGFAFIASGLGFLSNGLFEGSDGALYGVSADEGASNVFTLKKNGSGAAVINTLPVRTELATSLAEGKDGRLYGTILDLAPGWGNWFTLKKDGTDLKLDFNTATSPDGISPQAIIAASDGNLYATTDGQWVTDGGFISPGARSLQNPGTLFRITPAVVPVSPPPPPPFVPALIPTTGGTVPADSVQDFAGTQGNNGWIYGTFYGNSTTLQGLSFAAGTWSGTYSSLALTAQAQHPSFTDEIVQVSAVRRWLSNYEGTVNVIGAFQTGHDGDGVGVAVLVNGQPAVTRVLIGNGGPTESQPFNFDQLVHVGTTIDFVVDPGPARDINGDNPSVIAYISAKAPPPPPTTTTSSPTTTTSAPSSPPPTTPPPVSGETLLTNSTRDFSLTQGVNGWSYGDFRGDATTLDLLTSDGANWTGAYPSILIGDVILHPSFTAEIVQISAVRRWTSTVAGRIHIAGKFEIGHDGDSVGVSVLIDGVPAVTRTQIGNGNTLFEQSFDFYQTVRVGSVIDFAVDPGPARDINGDNAALAVNISLAQSSPPVTPPPPTSTASSSTTTSSSTAQPSGTVLADATLDFSTTQGNKGWTYGDFYGDSTTLELGTASGNAWSTGYPAVSITAGSQHPAFTNEIVQVSAVRRWTSNYAGTVHVVGKFQIAHDGDGVGVSILLDGKAILPRLIIGNSGTTQVQSFDLMISVHAGSQIDFTVDPGPARDINADNAHLNATISVP